MFQGWDRFLAPDVEFMGVRLPARDSRFGEVAIEDWDELVERVASALAPSLDRPFALYGHSFGARLAFQLAEHVQGMPNSQLQLLALSGCSPRHRGFFQPGLGEMPKPAFFSRLGELGGMPPEALEEPAFLALIEPALRADIRLSEAWHDLAADRVDVPIVAFAGTRDTLAPPPQMREWADATRRNFVFHELPGDHFFVRDHASAVLAAIDHDLHRQQAAPAPPSVAPISN